MGLFEKVLDLDPCFGGEDRLPRACERVWGWIRGLSVLEKGLCFRSEAADFIFIWQSDLAASLRLVTTIV